jgi:hypothetical protein
MPKFLIQTVCLTAGLDFLQAVEKLTLTKNLILPRTGVGWVSVKEVGRRLHRDPSIISRLYLACADRDQIKEKLLAQQLRRYCKTKA